MFLFPVHEGLFQRAISQSGSAFCPWGFSRTPREQALRLGNQVGCPYTDSEELVNCLVSLDPWDLIKPHEKLGVRGYHYVTQCFEINYLTYIRNVSCD